jgi:ABC-type transport system involved in cytochrome c biogenesis permease subunit
LSDYEDILRMREPWVGPPASPGPGWQPVARSVDAARRDMLGFVVEKMREEGRRPEQLSQKEIAALEGRIDRLAFERLPPSDPAAPFLRLTRAYAQNKAAEFNDALSELYERARQGTTEWDYRMAAVEAAFNHLAPFYRCMLAYVFVIPLTALFWLTGADWLRRAGLALATSTFLIHTAALVARMLIQWRPPVTNLYSSAIFIGWGCAGLLLLIEAIYRNGIAVCVSGVTAAASLFIAHMLGQSGDTLEMMQAVLDTNFWLATHVTAVTLGYTATFVAGFLAIAFILGRFTLPGFEDAAAKRLNSMVYGTVCFATLLSFLGTVLGGIWADQSWGRFWGWDPKENGAVLVVLWNALILHARWAGMVKWRGLAVLAVFGNVVTAWSWFGTNQLGVGLHSYGFTSGVASTLVGFAAFNLAIMTIGCLPRRWWVSTALAGSPPAKRRRTPTGTVA